ncbi:hypothetical protein [Nocardia sp. NPDC049149]|uniref:hypothetical protein n=1 Tax=Nocardia sp. NPDC049149 TaxID=3364315 RepID=UPI0037226B40
MALTSQQQEELLDEIERALRGGLPEGARGVFTWSSVGDGGSQAGFAVVDGGGKPIAHRHPEGLADLCWQLKKGMNRPEVGTWFTVRCEVDESGSFRADFDYDEEPSLRAIPEHYAKEMEWFPRDAAHTPDWLSAVLERVPNVYMGIVAEPGDQYEDEIGPHLGEVATAFRRAGWEVRRGHLGELDLSVEWGTLETLSSYGHIRFAGKIDPDRWTVLVDLMSQHGWNSGGELYEGGTVTAEFHRPDEGDAPSAR